MAASSIEDDAKDRTFLPSKEGREFAPLAIYPLSPPLKTNKYTCTNVKAFRRQVQKVQLLADQATSRRRFDLGHEGREFSSTRTDGRTNGEKITVARRSSIISTSPRGHAIAGATQRQSGTMRRARWGRAKSGEPSPTCLAPVTYGRLEPGVNATNSVRDTSRRQIRELRSIEIPAFPRLLRRRARGKRSIEAFSTVSLSIGLSGSLPSLRSLSLSLAHSLSLFLATRRSIGRYFRSRGCRFFSLPRKKLGEEHGEV